MIFPCVLILNGVFVQGLRFSKSITWPFKFSIGHMKTKCDSLLSHDSSQKCKLTVTFEHVMLCLKEWKYHIWNHVEKKTKRNHHDLNTEYTNVEKSSKDKNGKHIFFPY